MQFLTHNVAPALIIVCVGFIIGPYVKQWILHLSKTVPEKGIMTFLGSCASIVIKIMAIVIALSLLGINTNVIVGAFSALGLGISLALKDNMANVAAGVQILFTKPFDVGDYISVDSKEGYVTRIEIMYTIIRSLDNQDVIIPNLSLISNVVVNYSREDKRRIHIQIPVSLNADIDVCKEAFLEVMQNNNNVLKIEPISVVIDSFGESALNVGCFCWTKVSDYLPTVSQLNEQLYKTQKDHNIEGSSSVVEVITK